MTRALVFYPDNFTELNCGTHQRFVQFARYLADRSIAADLVSLDGFTPTRWNAASIDTARSHFDGVDVIPWVPPLHIRARNFVWQLLCGNTRLPNHALPRLQRHWNRLLHEKSYDFAVVNYVYWAKLLASVPEQTTTVLDLHDCITLNTRMRSDRTNAPFGTMLEDEVAAISTSCHAMSISIQDRMLLEPFSHGVVFHDIPLSMPTPLLKPVTPAYDILFLGSENVFNRDGIKWFLDSVYPHLSPNVRICVAGSVSRFVPSLPNVVALPRVDNLDTLYRDTRIVICPLLAGTGLKVKVVEALAYGRPVISTTGGLTGMPRGHERCCFVENDAVAFAKDIQRVLNDSDVYANASSAAIEFFAKHFSESVVWSALDHIFCPHRLDKNT